MFGHGHWNMQSMAGIAGNGRPFPGGTRSRRSHEIDYINRLCFELGFSIKNALGCMGHQFVTFESTGIYTVHPSFTR